MVAKGSGSSSLLTGLTAYYKLDDLTESVGGLTLTDHGSVTFTAGVGATFVSASSQYLTRADNAAFQMGTGDFSVACWGKFTGTTGTRNLVTYGAPTGSTGYGIMAVNAGFSFYILDGTTLRTIDSAGSWNGLAITLIIVTANRAGNATLYIHNTAETPVDITAANQSVNNTNGLGIGGRYDGVQLLDGQVGRVGFWNRVLTAGEISALWNGGAGITYPF